MGWGSLLDPAALARLPPELPRMAIAALLIAALTVIFWRPLKLSTFDEGFARAIGLPVTAIGLGLVIGRRRRRRRGLRRGRPRSS